MKRIWTSLLCIFMMMGLSVGCFAAEETLTNDKLSASHIVTAKYVCDYYNMEHYTAAEDADEDGLYTATTESGLKIEVRSDKKGLILIVHEITEADKKAAEWFKEQFQGMKNIAPLEIFFIDETGKRIDLPNGTEITLSNLKADQYIIGFSSKGRKNRYAEAVKGGKITIQSASGSDYYVVCTPGKAAGQPQTGDEAILWPFMAMMAISAAGVVIVGKKLKTEN